MRALLARLVTWLHHLFAASGPPEQAASQPSAKFQIDASGVASSLAHRVVLDHEKDLGVWVQPGMYDAVQKLEHEFTRLLMDGLDKRAEALGKKRGELADDDLKFFDPPMDESYIAALSSMFHSCFVTWDDGLVAFDGKFVRPGDVIRESEAAKDVWIDYMCRRQAETVMRICREAAMRARQLEGNSQGPSAGTGGTDEARQPAAAPESTVADAPSAAARERPEPCADTSAVSAHPV